jgi:flagellar protein FlaG
VPSAPAAATATEPQLRLPGTGREAAAARAAKIPVAAAANDVLSRAAQRVADSLGSGNSFSFVVDSQTGMTIVKVINRSTGELVRQIPSEEVVHIAQLLQQDEHKPVLDIRA